MQRIALDIGGVRLDAGFDEPLAGMVRREYAGFLATRPGETWRVDIAFDPTLVVVDGDDGLQLDRAHPVWVATSRAFRMMIDPQARIVVARLTKRHGPLGDTLPVRVHAALKAVVAFVTALEGGVTLHASAVLVNDEAVAFLGLSGAGKTTIATHLEKTLGATVLADDIVVALPTAKGLELHSTPFAGVITPGRARYSGPWKRAFTLQQAKRNFAIKPVDTSLAYRTFVRSLLAPQGDAAMEAELLARADTFFARLAWREVAFNLDGELTGTLMREHLNGS